MYHVTRNKNQQGQIIIIALVLTAVVIAIVGTLLGYAGVQVRSHKQAVARAQALNIAEAGIEAAVWKLNNQQGYNGESGTVYGAGVYNITITNLSGSSKLLKAEAAVPSTTSPLARRTVQITITTDAVGIGFNYGVQVGEGGLQMDNNSKVIGNVYSNGNIIGATNTRIQTGGATVAGVTGKIDNMQIDANANAHFIEDTTVGGSTTSASFLRGTVGGNAISDSISNCTIGGNATYDTKTSCTIGGSQTTPNPNPYDDPDIVNLPISDAQVDQWEQDAEAGGVITSYTLSNGASASLGPKKINGNLTLDNNATLTVTGTLWVTGQIDVSNGATIKLDSSYGSLGGVVLAGIDGDDSAGYIELDNGSNVLGSGTSGSYLLLLSQRNNQSSNAIKVSNNGTGAIIYAGEGVVELDNNAQMKEITAYKLRLKNNAIVTYESGLANAQFTSGPAAGWAVLDQTWQLLQ